MDRPPRKRIRHFSHPGQNAVENDPGASDARSDGSGIAESDAEAVAVVEQESHEAIDADSSFANTHSDNECDSSPNESCVDSTAGDPPMDSLPDTSHGQYGCPEDASAGSGSGGVWGAEIALAITDRLDQLASMMGRVEQRLDSLESRTDSQPNFQPPLTSPGNINSAELTEPDAQQDEADWEENEADAAAESEAVSQEILRSLLYETELLKEQLDSLVGDNHELRQQNEDLAAQLAQSNVQQTVQTHGGGDESLSWEERKSLIFKQMEDDSFDASSFIHSLNQSAKDTVDSVVAEDGAGGDPKSFVESLIERLHRVEAESQRREDEVEELRMLLQQKSESQQSGVVMGAAAIAGMVDSDDLVQQERERLHELKTEWEEKFRQAEIAASLERAKLSRERQELARKAAELEDQLAELQRERRNLKEPESGGRRWLAELGLTNEDE